jgi:hypothetical protein|mmetsp:Transcript_10755/g.14456  ORF Transcript_10755/g.14456 Transcript_10755/m.14456 type:complete len:227 (+) Transcript_10755:466-1146(+)
MDLLDKTAQQITEAEQDIYDDLVNSELDGLRRLDSGYQGDRTIFDTLSCVLGDASLENYEIVKRAAEAKGDSDVIAAEKSLKSLLTARARLYSAKADIQESILARMSGEQIMAAQQELNEFRDAASRYGIAAEGDDDATSADDVYSSQLQQIFDGEMRKLLSDIESCAKSQSERAAIYEEAGDVENSDSFRQDMLKHLAGSLVIKEHRIRYQKEQFDRFIASLTQP